MSPDLSVIMPCRNRRSELQQALESLCSQTAPAHRFEVVVVDQDSSDGSREAARSFGCRLDMRLVEQDAAYGPSAARNAGIWAARAPLVVLLDCDMVADPGLLDGHLACQAVNPGALVCGRMLPYPLAYRSFVDRAADPEGGLDGRDIDGELPFYQVFSGNLSARQETLERTGLFDPGLAAFEDVDLGYRAHRRHVPIVGCAQALAYHNHARSLEERMSQARAYMRVWPVLLRRYPELRGTVPGVCGFEPIRWGNEPVARVWAKMRPRFWAAEPVPLVLRAFLELLERHRQLPRVAKALYWRLWLAHSYAGFKEGSRG